MEPEEIQPLKETRAYLDQWMKRYKKANEVAPKVQDLLDIIDWRIQAYENCPKEARTVFPANLFEQHRRSHTFIIGNIPMIPDYNKGDVFKAFAVGTSGATVTFSSVHRAKDLLIPESKSYSERFTIKYITLQDSQGRPKEVRDLIVKLGSANILQRFDRALKAKDSVKIGIGERTSAAIEIRTLLEGLKGNLWQRAKNWPKENMTWREMAKRLAKNGFGGTEYHELLRQEDTYTHFLVSYRQSLRIEKVNYLMISKVFGHKH
jgi:hypothetical protein